MKMDALNEALDLLGSTRTNDLGAVDRVMKAARVELAALSSVPEDVARDWGDVVKAIHPGVQVQDWSPPLARLRNAAARVPGLEAACAEYERTINEDIDGKLALRRELGATDSETYPAFVRRLASERDAARQEVERLTEQLKYVTRAMEEGMGALRAQVEALREDNATLSALAKRGGAVLEERDALTTRVAELEAKWKAAEADGDEARAEWKRCLEHAKRLEAEKTQSILSAQAQAEAALARIEKAEARATAAEEKVTELEGTIQRLERRDMQRRGFVSQLQDTVQRLKEGSPETATTPPTPAPGLMRIEPHTPTLAASLELEKEVDADWHRDEDEARGSAMVSGGTPREAELEAVRATDAALAEERRILATPAPGLREAVGKALALHDRKCMVANEEWGDAFDALRAAYSATPATVTHAALVLVVAGIEEECVRVGQAHEAKSKDENDADSWLAAEKQAQAAGAHEVLRRVTGGEVPEVLPKARVAEVLATVVTRARAAASNTHEAGDPLREALANLYTGEANGATEAAEMLGLTLTTGPGGGETERHLSSCPQALDYALPEWKCTCAETRAVFAEAATQRARIPTPTPTSPPLTQPEPAAPEVVWEGDGVRVLADGTWEFFGESIPEWLPGNGSEDVRIDALAHALAEAKRENADLKTEVELKQAALDGQSRDYRDARKAAEDMRERAAKYHDDAGDKVRAWLDANENRALASTLTAQRTRLETHRQAAIAIRDLSLE